MQIRHCLAAGTDTRVWITLLSPESGIYPAERRLHGPARTVSGVRRSVAIGLVFWGRKGFAAGETALYS